MTLQDHELQVENERLKERVAQLETVLGFNQDIPTCLKLSRQERAIFGVILARDLARREEIFEAMYQDKKVRPGEKILHVYINKIRHKIRPHGLDFICLHGIGYRMTPEMKAEVAELVRAERGEA